MKDRRPDPNQRAGNEQNRIGPGKSDQRQPDERETHAEGQEIRLRANVRIEADQRLKQRSGGLKGESDEADLAEIQPKGGFQDRIERRHERLHHIVEEMAETDGEEDREDGLVRRHRRHDAMRFLDVSSLQRHVKSPGKERIAPAPYRPGRRFVAL